MPADAVEAWPCLSRKISPRDYSFGGAAQLIYRIIYNWCRLYLVFARLQLSRRPVTSPDTWRSFSASDDRFLLYIVQQQVDFCPVFPQGQHIIGGSSDCAAHASVKVDICSEAPGGNGAIASIGFRPSKRDAEKRSEGGTLPIAMHGLIAHNHQQYSYKIVKENKRTSYKRTSGYWGTSI